MKKKLIFLLFFGLISANLFLFAQRDERRRAEFEELKEKRVAFISKAMDLNANEAKAFWPLDDELQHKKFELNRQMRRALSEFRGNGRESEKPSQKRTEKEYKDAVNLYLKFKADEIKLEEEYTAKFAKVISFEKIYKYQQAEQQFARQMLNQRRP